MESAKKPDQSGEACFIMPHGTEVKGETISFKELFRRCCKLRVKDICPEIAETNPTFGETTFGEILKGRVRFGRYRPGYSPDKSETDKSEGVAGEQWIKLLGPDVDNLRHHVVLWGIAREFLSFRERPKEERGPSPFFSKREWQILLVAVLVHDFPEAIGGDITFEKKTEEEAKREGEIMRRILHKVGLESIASEIMEVLDKRERERDCPRPSTL